MSSINSTATRVRWRALWVRPSFNVVYQSRFATNRRSLSFVTSGARMHYPGVWALLKDSSIVGVSANNPDRFGPRGALFLRSASSKGAVSADVSMPHLLDRDPVNSGVFLATAFLHPSGTSSAFRSMMDHRLLSITAWSTSCRIRALC